jgi:predicted ferric reductase
MAGRRSGDGLHQHASLLGLGFALFHGLILLGDRFANYSLLQIVAPFAVTGYRPLWVGIGQLGFYAMALVALSFNVRKSLGTRAWRTIHYSAVVYALIAHGVMSGSIRLCCFPGPLGDGRPALSDAYRIIAPPP